MMKKIKIIVAYDEETIKNKIINILKKIEDVEIVAISNNAEDTYNKIIELKPEMVFSKYDFGSTINTLDIIKKAKSTLKDDVPVFNMIATDIPKKEFLEIRKSIGDKMNTIIREHSEERYIGIIEDYKEYLEINKKLKFNNNYEN